MSNHFDGNLTDGAVMLMSNKTTAERVQNPVVQVLVVKKIAANNNNNLERHRVVISDGRYMQKSTMLATGLSDLVNTEQIVRYSVIRIKKFICSIVQQRLIIVITDVDVLSPNPNTKIGNPADIDVVNNGSDAGDDGASAAPAAPASEMSDSRPTPMVTSSGAAAAAAPSATSASFYSGSGAPVASSRAATSVSPGHNPYARFAARSSDTGSFGGGNFEPQANIEEMIAKGELPATVPISALSQYSHRFVIRARVNTKSPVRYFEKNGRKGSLFSVDLSDESGMIRATSFGDQNPSKFFDILQPGKAYFFSKMGLKPANQQYNKLDHQFELQFESGTQVVECADENGLPAFTFNFVNISQIEGVEKDKFVDFIGVCTNPGAVMAFQAKTTQKELKKREITLKDQTCKVIKLTLWGSQAESFAEEGFPVIAVKGAKVSDFGGRSLSLVSSSTMQINPDIPEAHVLRGWYDTEGAHVGDVPLAATASSGASSYVAPRKTIGYLQSLELGDNSEVASVKGTVTVFKKEITLYPSCPQESCKGKKLEDDTKKCILCGEEFKDSFKWSIILTFNIADHTGAAWVQAFRLPAETVLRTDRADDDVTVEVLGPMSSAEREKYLAAAIGSEFVFNVRIKKENYNGVAKTRLTATNVFPINYSKESKLLIEQIKKLSV